MGIPKPNHDFPYLPGLSEKDRKYHLDCIKGQVAQAIIHQLFLSLKYNIFRYGMENTIPGVMDLLKGVRTGVAQDICRMPNFVIQHPGIKDVHFVEVKFRAEGYFDFSGLKGDYPWMNAYIVVVSKKHIKCLSAKELKEGKKITPECRNYLGSRKELETDRKVIVDFCKFAVKFFEGV